nr:MAG TPA: hypothetical protein [Caudoviricetes sp.]DAQ73466.1 MAG TPA: hypothetical protein [Caudoviricetes sp.]DAW83154.1 MAG TPA: hypothetical protein [Caudoviricetes sp.]
MSTNPIGIFHQFHYVVLPFRLILQWYYFSIFEKCFLLISINT